MFSFMRNGLSGQIHLPLLWLNTAMNDIATKSWEEPRATVLFFAQPATSKVFLFLLWSDRTPVHLASSLNTEASAPLFASSSFLALVRKNPVHLVSSPNTTIIRSICTIIGKSRSETIGMQFYCKCGWTNNRLFWSNTCPVLMKTPSWLWMPCLYDTIRKDILFVERAHY